MFMLNNLERNTFIAPNLELTNKLFHIFRNSGLLAALGLYFPDKNTLTYSSIGATPYKFWIPLNPDETNESKKRFDYYHWYKLITDNKNLE